MAEIKVYTTPPYSVLVEESFTANSKSIYGWSMEQPADEVSIESAALEGNLRDVTHPYNNSLSDEFDIHSMALDGILRISIVYYSVSPENFDTTSIALDGILRVVLLPYLNYPPDEFDIGSVALNGALT